MLWRGVNKWKLCYPQERFIQWTALSTLAPLEPGQLTNHPVILSDQPVSLSAGLIFSQLPIFLLQIPQSLYRLHIAQVFLNMWWYLRPWHLMILPTEEALLGKQLLPLKGPHPVREKKFCSILTAALQFHRQRVRPLCLWQETQRGPTYKKWKKMVVFTIMLICWKLWYVSIDMPVKIFWSINEMRELQSNELLIFLSWWNPRILPISKQLPVYLYSAQ